MKLGHIEPTWREWMLLAALMSGVSLCGYGAIEYDKRYPPRERPWWGFPFVLLNIPLILAQVAAICHILGHLIEYYRLFRCPPPETPPQEDPCRVACEERWRRWSDGFDEWWVRQATAWTAFILCVEPHDLEPPVGLLDEERGLKREEGVKREGPQE